MGTFYMLMVFAFYDSMTVIVSIMIDILENVEINTKFFVPLMSIVIDH